MQSSNSILEKPNRTGMSDHRLEQRCRLRSVRAIRGTDSEANLNKALWDRPNGRSPAPFAT